jgi:signal transduction histidine kinase
MRKRILLGFLTLTILVLVVLEVPLGVTYAHRQSDELSTQLQRDAFFIASVTEDRLERHGGTGLQTKIDDYAKRYGPRVVVVDERGVVVADSDPLSGADKSMRTRPEIAQALRGRVASGRRHSSDLHTDLLYVAVPVASGGNVHGAVRLTYSTKILDRRVRSYWVRLGLVGLVSLVGAAALGTALARSATRPLHQVEQATTRFGAGALDVRAPVTGPIEVQAMAATFNDMADRLATLIGAQEAFVSNASHQLRTPLTALRLRLENVQEETSGEAADDVEAALNELSRMGRLVDGLLALARADALSGTPPADVVDVGSVLADRRSSWEALAAEHDIDIELRLPERHHAPLAVRATVDRLDQALDNLLANALDASEEGTSIALWAEPVAGRVAIHVTDSGPGLSAEDRARAFDRFWRADGSQARFGGSGLGLAIVRTLVAADGGTVELREADTGGVDAVITLRAASAAT